MAISFINNLSRENTFSALEKCCVSKTWINGMVNSIPFDSANALFLASDKSWASCAEPDWLEAFTGHPKIGDVSSLAKKFANTHTWAGNEQSGMNKADMKIIEQLAKGNQDYEGKFGFIFIVCATGKSAKEMLDLLLLRLPNSREKELKIAAAEQHKITRIRLGKLLGSNL